MHQAENKARKPNRTWENLGMHGDDPNIQRIFHDLDNAHNAIMKEGFGKKPYKNPI